MGARGDRARLRALPSRSRSRPGQTGNWDPWCDLFTLDCTYIEAQAGSIGGRDALKRLYQQHLHDVPGQALHLLAGRVVHDRRLPRAGCRRASTCACRTPATARSARSTATACSSTRATTCGPSRRTSTTRRGSMSMVDRWIDAKRRCDPMWDVTQETGGDPYSSRSRAGGLSAMARIDLPEATSSPRGSQLSPHRRRPRRVRRRTSTRKSRLSRREFEAARVRVAESNRCVTCLNTRYEDGDETRGSTRRSTPTSRTGRPIAGYSERERLAIEFAERFCERWTDDDPDVLGAPARGVQRRRDRRSRAPGRRARRRRPHPAHARHRADVRPHHPPRPEHGAAPARHALTERRVNPAPERRIHSPNGARSPSADVGESWRSPED